MILGQSEGIKKTMIKNIKRHKNEHDKIFQVDIMPSVKSTEVFRETHDFKPCNASAS